MKKRSKGRIYLSWLFCLRFFIPYLFLGSGPEGDDVLAGYRSHRLSLLFSFGDGPMTPALNAAPPYDESGAAWRLMWRRLTLNAALPGAEYINEYSPEEDPWELD